MRLVCVGNVNDCWKYKQLLKKDLVNPDRTIDISVDNLDLLKALLIEAGDTVVLVNIPLSELEHQIEGVIYTYVHIPNSPDTVAQCQLQASDWEVIRMLEEMFLADTELHAKRKELRALVPEKYSTNPI